MRTYSHVLLTLAAARRARPDGQAAPWAAAGALLPDVPAGVGTAWLWARRRKAPSREEFEKDVCGRSLFCAPDAALHAALPPTVTLAAALALGGLPGVPGRLRDAALAFSLGWAGHAAADALTHGTDARPLLWPISNRRFESPVSYREHDRHAATFTAVEHLALVAASYGLSAVRKSKRPTADGAVRFADRF